MSETINVTEFLTAELAPDAPATHVFVEIMTGSSLLTLRLPKSVARELVANLAGLRLGPYSE